jgi:hypothetical protein
MKIILTEGQLENLMNEYSRLPLPQKEVDKRLKKSKSLAVKFTNPRQFSLKYPNLWNFLRKKGLVDVVFPNRKIYRPDGYWTPETIAQEASKYNTKSEFHDNNQVAYLKAIELGIINDLFPHKSDTKVGAKKIWTLEKSIETAKEFNGSPNEFSIKHPAAYFELKNNNLLSYYFKKRKDIYDEEIIKQAKQYKDRVELKKNNLTLYNKLVTRGLLYILFPKVEMNDDEIINMAKEYQTTSELSKKNRPLYYKLSKIPNGFEMVFDGQHKLTYKAKKFIDIAKQYDNKYELRKSNRYTYNNLESLGLLDKVFPFKSVEKLSLTGTLLQDILKSKENNNQNPKLPKKKLKFGNFGSLENLTKWVAPYKTKKELERKNPLAYICVRENGLFDYFGLK